MIEDPLLQETSSWDAVMNAVKIGSAVAITGAIILLLSANP
ncbi:MAG: hypothetical protein ACFC1C_02705 [Candidatus Malihini olakiniferum]